MRVFIQFNIKKIPFALNIFSRLGATCLVRSRGALRWAALTNATSGGVLRKELWPPAEEMDADLLGR